MTWQQYFLAAALDTWSNFQALSHEANAAGFQLPEEDVIHLEDLPETLELNAKQMGYESAEAMLQRDMGPGATLEGYVNFQANYYMGNMYYLDTLEQIPVTDADVAAYFDAHAEEYKANGLEKTDERYVDVRHILICPESAEGASTYTEAEWAAAEVKANEVLNEWLTKNPTEDGFAVLAETYSMDPGSVSNGGLYEDVYKGQMVPEFDSAVFAMEVGEITKTPVKTQFGYHLIKLIAKNESKVAEFDTVKDELREMLIAERRQSAFQSKINQLKIVYPTDILA